MKKYYIYGLLALSAVALSSCSDDEELLEPTANYIDNKFMVPDDATGPEAELRRQFFADNGIYLIYDDLLSRESVGTDANGQEIWQEERVDFLYDLTAYGTSAPKFDLLDNQEDKEAAAELIEKYILPHIEGGALRPFSVLPVKTLQTYQYKNYKYGYYDAYTVSCWRCLAIATEEWEQAEDDEKETIAATILKDFLSTRFTYQSASVKDFYDLSMEYSGYYMDEIYDDWEDDPDISRAYEIGFLYMNSGWWGEYLPYTQDDFNSYFDMVLSKSEAEVNEEYGDYPMIIKKYEIVRNALISLGYKF